jgi:hypothetical protein
MEAIMQRLFAILKRVSKRRNVREIDGLVYMREPVLTERHTRRGKDVIKETKTWMPVGIG